jgi:hypothetical protein
MTEIRESNFSLDLPGTWEEVERGESTVEYGEVEGRGSVAVTLLGVKPLFAIADSKRLLDDYLSHRAKYEVGQNPALEPSEPHSRERDESVEGGWDARDATDGSRIRHRVVLVGTLLADFRFGASGLDEDEFDAQADLVLGSAVVRAPV